MKLSWPWTTRGQNIEGCREASTRLAGEEDFDPHARRATAPHCTQTARSPPRGEVFPSPHTTHTRDPACSYTRSPIEMKLLTALTEISS